MVAVSPPQQQESDHPEEHEFPAEKYLTASRKWIGKLMIVYPSIMKVIDGRISGKDVIDIGCGDGKFGQDLIQLGANKVTGIDSNHAMILQCKTKYNGTFKLGPHFLSHLSSKE